MHVELKMDESEGSLRALATLLAEGRIGEARRMFGNHGGDRSLVVKYLGDLGYYTPSQREIILDFLMSRISYNDFQTRFAAVNSGARF